MAKNKYYVVWKGITPGVYDNWGECKAQVDGQDGAKYKSFETKEEATKAFVWMLLVAGIRETWNTGASIRQPCKRSSGSGR